MKSSRCLFSTATALHRVFIAPIEQQSLLRLAPHSISHLVRLPTHHHIQHRTLVSSTKAEKSRLPRDDEILAWSVSLATDSGLQDARSTADILASLDRKTQSLCVVVPGEPGVPPICKIMNKQAMREAERARHKAAKTQGGVTQKTMELNWAIDGHDLEHRLGKLRGFLEKGWRVEIVVAGKKKGRKASEEEGESVLKKIRGVLNEVGGKEIKPMEMKKVGDGKLLGQATLYTEGKIRKEEKSGGLEGKKKEEKPAEAVAEAA